MDLLKVRKSTRSSPFQGNSMKGPKNVHLGWKLGENILSDAWDEEKESKRTAYGYRHNGKQAANPMVISVSAPTTKVMPVYSKPVRLEAVCRSRDGTKQSNSLMTS